ncbi:MbcA/ParS/Xre antitoxin family protein [Allohahella marinimesophila]|uniref:Antitoxin Xre/MbcA/ParS-like toxin-binding domain-containing protein n=1 Tax=Allohahella marinimesophila TaxID=1054972 RepID=A0ABP7Q7W7_9GAMM
MAKKASSREKDVEERLRLLQQAAKQVELWNDCLDLLDLNTDEKSARRNIIGRLVRAIDDEIPSSIDAISETIGSESVISDDLMKKAIIALRSAEKAGRWFDTPTPVFGGKSPTDFLKEGGHSDYVVNELLNIQHSQLA